MARPSFVNSGGWSFLSAVSGITPALPASRVNGNLLFAFFRTDSGASFTTPTGWNGPLNASGFTECFWRIVDGTETAPAFHWTGTKNAQAEVFQFTGNLTVNPIGGNHVNSGTGTALSTGNITTVTDDALIIALFTDDSAPLTAPGAPWAHLEDNTNFVASMYLAWKAGPTPAALTGGPSSTTSPSTNWSAYAYEIKNPGTVTATSTITQTLSGISQDAAGKVSIVARPAQTLTGFSQAAAGTVVEPTVIGQTLLPVTEAAAAVEKLPGSIDQTLFGISEASAEAEREPTFIDQTLFGFSQEIDAVESFVASVDQTLPGFSEEIHVVSPVGDGITAVIAQTFRRRFAVQLVLADIAQTFRRRLVTNTASAAITTDLPGFSQRIGVRNVALGTHPLRPGQSGIAEPGMFRDPDMPNAELELFREKLYARSVAAAVPPTRIAARLLTTTQLPTSRPVVNRTPLGKK